MRKVLVTGQSGYIGTKFNEWIIKNNLDIQLDFISVKNNEWYEADFSKYDSILHLAGLVHENKHVDNSLYYEINQKLTVKIASKAKREQVKQFIFFSTMNIFGVNEGTITKITKPNPKTAYGKSKYRAEIELQEMESEDFFVAVIRPPMVYGENCPGNFAKLERLIKKINLFPQINNKRSMIYIDNLCEFIYLILKNKEKGVYHPQNSKFISTSLLVKEISKVSEKKVFFVRGLKWNIKFCMIFSNSIKKMFGNLTYDFKMSEYKEVYSKISFEQSIINMLKGDQ